MAITINHPFVSAKGDGSDATLVRPSNWNASHNLNMATSRIVGRLTAGPGLAEELPVTSFMIGLLNTADFAALAVALGLPTTGDAKLTFKIVADAGWILANDGSIGDALSGATTLAHATATAALFTFFYDTFSDAIAPLQLSTGGVTTRAVQGAAGTAFSAHCRMVIPRQLGRALIIAGTGAGLTARAVGGFGGEESHTMSLAELAAHAHNVTAAGTLDSKDLNHTHTQTGSFTSGNESVNHTHTQTGSFTSGGISANHHHHVDVGGGQTGTVSAWHGHGYKKPALNTSTTGGGNFFIVGTETDATTGDPNANHTHSWGGGYDTGDVSSNHTHDTTISGQTGTVSAFHTHSTTISGQTGFMSASNSHSHTFTGTAVTSVSVGSSTPFNVMQPWTAWNIMIKL